jgi:hypothetical protein
MTPEQFKLISKQLETMNDLLLKILEKNDRL